MPKIVLYDKENDILTVHKGFSRDEKFKGNIDAGELVLDVSTKGRVRGIEVMNAAKFFKEFEISRRALENILDAEFRATIKPDCIIVGLVIKAKNAKKELAAKIAVPLEPACA